MSIDPSTETGVRARTRRAIINAAITTWAKTPTAPLGDIAAAAEVGRTTLHRYFPERADLVAAIARHCDDAVRASASRARLTEGDAVAAVLRLTQEYFDLGDLLSVLFFTPGVYQEDSWCITPDADAASAIGTVDPDLAAVVARGHSDGSIDPQMSALWIQNLLWATLYTALTLVASSDITRLDALALTVRTLRRAIVPDTLQQSSK